MAEGSTLANLMGSTLDALGHPDRGLRSLIDGARQRAVDRAPSAGGRAPAVPRPQPPTPLPPLPRELDALGRVSAANDRAAHAALTAQADEIEGLKRSQAELAQKLEALQQQTDRMLVGLFDGIAGLERQVETVTARSQALATQTRAARSLAVRQAEELRALSVTTQLDKVSAVVNTVQSAAYGRSGDPLAFNNVALAANQLFWSFLEPFLKSFGIVNGTAPSVVTWLAPLGTLLTGQLVMADRQHVRFLSGVAVFEGGASVVNVSLHDRVAPGFRAELERRSDLPVGLTPVAPALGGFRADVRKGTLRIVRLGDAAGAIPPGGARVAWMIDLGGDIG